MEGASGNCRNKSYVRIGKDVLDWRKADRAGWLDRLLSQVFPRGNPDFDRLYPEISCWYVELDGQKPVREIGFASDGQAIVLGPFGTNYGLWTDSPVLLNPADYEAISEEEFDSSWEAAAEALEKIRGEEPPK